MSSMQPTLGAALAGCMVAVGLSAVLGFQTFLYFQIFPSDANSYKLLVAWLWLSDAVHTVLMCTAIWQYIIVNFSNPDIVNKIFPAIPSIVSLTALITLSVNTFYGWRIHKLSKHNWWLSGPIAVLSVIRVGLAFTTTTEMLLEKTFTAFAAKFKVLFTSGLAISAVTDIIVSSARYYYLRNVRQGYSMTHEAVDAVVVFTINDGFLTCGVVLASIICWLSMHNFVYLAIYFSIAKLYSNSVLATLNLRNWYRHRYVGSRPLGIQMKRPVGGVNAPDPHASMAPGVNSNSLPTHKHVTSADMHGLPGKMEVFVDHQVEYNVGDFPRGEVDRYDVDTHSNKSMNVA
ncbi:hypothetical protein DFH07DRAFT_962770 [Mycena maculata]|uniref:DUF6534 domain-containing protein n=1 Tax=Mycena maculata TaxID=230809 RepID=A0AAD7N5L9_9AGAR|nr:hypothetical protein DFH07DRAFT_962770 [Mycena maculata]